MEWKRIEDMPPELMDGRRVLLWLPWGKAEVLCWDVQWQTWVDGPLDPLDRMEGPYGTGSAIPSHYAEIVPPAARQQQERG